MRTRQILRPVIMLLTVVSAAACSAPEEVALQSEGPEAFLQQLRNDLEAHAWQSIIAAADTAHYRIQVVEHGMAEPQYVAELLGLHREGNDVGQGDGVSWSDLEQIETVRFLEPVWTGSEYTVEGSARLSGGRRLEIEARVVEEDGTYRLTGAVG